MTWDAEHTARMDGNNKTFDEEYKRVFEHIEEATIPQSGTVEFPDDWAEISRSASRARSVTPTTRRRTRARPRSSRPSRRSA